ncbi:hypothetical protein BXZ70DRAFT_510247 [Cristinia sonorae]|uniref:SET domain-containing protein n=1 Tax=Cristinia sonorae TaxID=1940300 RepID=A0A8K0UW53_9AGAR|nr:hypothetical protein BXZ70DRAFT_510247 [Cristinia sonorae]
MGPLPYGLVEKTGLPPGVEKLKYENTEFSAGRLDYAPMQKIHTTQPLRYDERDRLTLPLDPVMTECYISGFLKRKILSTPGIGSRMLRPSSTMHRISESPGKGLGMFATKDIPAGELIVADRPLLIFPRNIATQRTGAVPLHLTMHEMQQVILNDTEVIYKASVDRMEPDRKEAFFKLANSHTDDGSGPIVGRVRTNGFGSADMMDLGEGTAGQYTIICDELSRLNHSCSPNTKHFWDMPTFCMQLRATRHIKKDEELTTTYCDLMESAADRQATLDAYQLKCDCASCANPAISDPRRRKCREWGNQNDGRVLADLDPAPLNRLLDVFKAYIAEGLEETIGYSQVVFLLMNAYAEKGDVQNMRVYAKRLSLWKHVSNGDPVDPREIETGFGALAVAEMALRLKGKLKRK